MFTKLQTSIDENLISGTPTKCNLQNCPNPLKYSTIIKYHVPIAGFVTIKVYDINGNIITTLVNENKQIGDYNTIFYASGIAGGSYFCRIQINNVFYETKKMIIVK